MAGPMPRGANVALTRELPNLKAVAFGVAWKGDANVTKDLVLATILCDASSHALSDDHVALTRALEASPLSQPQAAAALGDDVEQIEVDLTATPPEVMRIVVVLYTSGASTTPRTLKGLTDCSVRLLNLEDNQELVRSVNLADSLTTETAVTLGELYRLGADWKFKVLGQGYTTGINGLATDYRISTSG